MGERDVYWRYSTARQYADAQAEQFKRGETLHGWTSAVDWREGQPVPLVHALQGEAWIAHLYEIAGRDAQVLVQTRGHQWQVVADDCQRRASRYRTPKDEQA
jgi:hypothetical protein